MAAVGMVWGIGKKISTRFSSFDLANAKQYQIANCKLLFNRCTHKHIAYAPPNVYLFLQCFRQQTLDNLWIGFVCVHFQFSPNSCKIVNVHFKAKSAI